MNETFPAELKVESEVAAKPASGLTLLALLLALLALAGSGWLWWQGQAKENSAANLSAEAARQTQSISAVEGRLADLEARVSSVASADPANRINGIEQEMKSLQTQVDSAKSFQDQTTAWTRTMQAVIESDQSRLAAAEERLAAMSARNLKASEELDLAEIDYLLRMAQERLVLFGDNRTAAEALRIAGEEVQAFDNPLYLGLSSEIARAQQSAAQVATPDYAALYSKLDALQGLVGGMRLKGAEAPVAVPAVDETASWWVRVRDAFSGLVTVRRTTALEDELPLMADQALVRQQAWLELEVARLAAMRRDQQTFQAALDRFNVVLDRWFAAAVPNQPGGRTEAAVLLDALKLLNVDPELPDISAPLKTLQTIRAAGLADSIPAASLNFPAASSPLPSEAPAEESPEPEATADAQ